MYSTEILPCKNPNVARLLKQRGQAVAVSMDDVAVEFTDRCFQRCRLCYGNFGTNAREMPFEQVTDLKNKFKPAGIKIVHSTGGEFLWHRQVRNILQLFGESGFRQEVDTNGTLIDEPMAKLLAKYKVEVTVGMESIDPEVYRWYRGLDQLNKVINGLQLLKNKGLRPGVQAVVANFRGYPGQYDPVKNYLELVGFVTKMGLPISLIQYRPMGRAVQNTDEVTDLTRQEKNQLMQQINLLPDNQRRLVNGDIIFQKQLGVPEGIECSGCLGGLTRANIDVDGNVFMCNWRREDIFGNVFSEDLVPIVARMQQYRWQKLDEISSCGASVCDFRQRGQCFGPCLVSKMAKPDIQ